MWGNRVLAGGLLLVGVAAALVGGWAEWIDRTDALALVQAMGSTLVGVSWAAIGGVLAWLRPGNALGWLMLVVGVITQLGLSEAAYARSVGLGEPGQAASWAERPAGFAIALVAGFAIFVMIGLLPVLYPTGALPGKAWRWPSIAVVVGAALLQGGWLVEDASEASGSAVSPLLLGGIVYVGGILSVWVLSVVRLVKASSPERQQLVWLFASVVGLFLTQSLGSTPEALWAQLPFLYLLPVAIAVGILKYRLLGIEAVLRRGLVYGVLTAAIFALYAVVAIAAGVQLTGAALPAVIAAGLVAVGLAPLSSWLQRLVDRLLYGQRGDPIRAVTDVGSWVEGAGEDEMLESVLRGVQTSVKARGGRIRSEDGRSLAWVGDPGDAAFSAQLMVGGSPVGLLELTGRGPGERYSGQDERMLRAMVPQLAVVVRALQLAGALQEQRDAVVGATRRERDRLRRDLHDGLGPSLTGVGLGLQALEDAVSVGDQEKATKIAEVLRAGMAHSVAEVRHILDGLGPTALAEESLEEAIRRQVASSPIPVTVDIAALPPLPSDLEETVYRVVGEAITNALKHADASRIVVEAAMVGTDLVVRVIDDGGGFQPTPTGRGIGLASMHERAGSCGGRLAVDSGGSGTTVQLVVPIGVMVNE